MSFLSQALSNALISAHFRPSLPSFHRADRQPQHCNSEKAKAERNEEEPQGLPNTAPGMSSPCLALGVWCGLVLDRHHAPRHTTAVCMRSVMAVAANNRSKETEERGRANAHPPTWLARTAVSPRLLACLLSPSRSWLASALDTTARGKCLTVVVWAKSKALCLPAAAAVSVATTTTTSQHLSSLASSTSAARQIRNRWRAAHQLGCLGTQPTYLPCLSMS
ncbi:hypothetical protein IWX90DRAFT_81429 [Phyllosticta citrichinensis]|uniref:Uncharacterized protein n=1 Tax=Phyllosticta citrichinensis TaxID=1130410 RepID=A0ABR1XFZ0_9PEZI